MVTDTNNEDRLVQRTFAEHLEQALGWESAHACNVETFGPNGALGRADTREVVLTPDLRAALAGFNPQLPAEALEDAVRQLTRYDFSRSLLQHNQEFYRLIRDGVPVEYRDAQVPTRHTPPFTTSGKEGIAGRIYLHVWQQCLSGELRLASAA